MKHLIPLLLACLLLSGCHASLPQPTAIPAAEATSEDTTLSTREQLQQSALVAFSPNISDVYGIRSFGDGLLVFSGKDTTTLHLFAGDTLTRLSWIQLEDFLSHQDPSLQIREQTLSYFKAGSRETVVLDSTLSEVHRIAAPAGLVGCPLLSEDQATLYYCTEFAVRAWDLDKDIRRTLKEMRYSQQTLAGLHLEDGLLHCRVLDGQQDRSLFLSTQTGQLFAQQNGNVTMTSGNGQYFICLPAGFSHTLITGVGSGSPQLLLPHTPGGDCSFLENAGIAVTGHTPSEGNFRLDAYTLASGLRSASLTLKSTSPPACIAAAGSYVWLLVVGPDQSSPVLYRWDPTQTPLADTRNYLHPYHSAEDPDLPGLAACRQYAQQIGEKYGIRVLIWKDALAAQPWDYDFEAEYLVPVLEEELLALDQRLSHYAPGMLEQTASHFSSLSICLVRSIHGSAESGSLEAAAGVQYLDGSDAYVALAVGKFSERTLYHELFHVMETHILNGSVAFDEWNSLNPAGFAYDYSYADNSVRDSGVYLHAENRSFVDTYSMSFPKEDRARILEYAMLPGNRELFQYPALQRKLQAVCHGIRDAYGLEKDETVFLWEQYLDT